MGMPGIRTLVASLGLAALGACGGIQQQSLNGSLNLRVGEQAPQIRTKTLADVRAIVGVNDVVEGDGEELCRRVAQQPAQRWVDSPHAAVRRRHSHADR